MTDRGQEQPFVYSEKSKRIVANFPALDGMIGKFSLVIRESAKPKISISEITVRPHIYMEEPDWEGVMVDVVAQGSDRVMMWWRRRLAKSFRDFCLGLEPENEQLFKDRVNFQIRTYKV